MKKFVCVCISLLFILVSCTNTKEENSTVQKHDCVTEGHIYVKNTCSECNYEATDFSEFSLSYREQIASQLEKYAPSTEPIEKSSLVEIKTIWFERYLLLEEAIAEVEEKEKAVEDAKKNLSVRVYNSATGEWEWQADERKVSSAESQLRTAQNNYNLKLYYFNDVDYSLDCNSEICAWNEVIKQIRNVVCSNKSIYTTLNSVITIYISDTNKTAEWDDKLIDSIYYFSGIKIKNIE